MNSVKTCETCIFSVSVKSQHEIGKVETACRRYPPTPIALTAQTPHGMQVQIITAFPVVAPGTSCGEHTSAPTLSS